LTAGLLLCSSCERTSFDRTPPPPTYRVLHQDSCRLGLAIHAISISMPIPVKVADTLRFWRMRRRLSLVLPRLFATTLYLALYKTAHDWGGLFSILFVNSDAVFCMA
jgi:hypothetical protein